RRHRALCSSTSVALISLVIIAALGGAATAVHGGMQGLAARFRRQAFERDFTEAQFLLNTADTSDRHLRVGLAKAQELLDPLPPPVGGRPPRPRRGLFPPPPGGRAPRAGGGGGGADDPRGGGPRAACAPAGGRVLSDEGPPAGDRPPRSGRARRRPRPGRPL